jgi:RHH-type transcriptional regulator, proline utilization regulon repressor / proline dehydrogenase / delta 1-pyrroline-5-carboxylate dehydrogenase
MVQARQTDILELGRQMLSEMHAAPAPVLRRAFHEDEFIDRLLADAQLKRQLLYFVDLLPSLRTDRDVAEHLDMYIGESSLPIPWPRLAKWGLHHMRRGLPSHLVALTAAAMCRRMARRFIAGEDLDETLSVLGRLWKNSMGFTLDVLGEASTGEKKARQYAQQYLDLIGAISSACVRWDRTQHSPKRRPEAQLSIKVSALYSQISAVDPDGSIAAVKNRLRPIFQAALGADVAITLDMEQFDLRHITLQVFYELLNEPEFRRWTGAGIAMQAYLQDTPLQLERLVQWAKQRDAPVTVRLVRGAYWDYELMLALQNNWPVPVWRYKSGTDRCYEQCTEYLLRHHPMVHTAIATHNLRSICLAMVLARDAKLHPNDYEFQMLYGMGDALKESLVRRGQNLRVYVPYGPLLPGMAYLVRRLLENSSNESFLKLSSQSSMPPEQLLTVPPEEPPQTTPQSRPSKDSQIAPFSNEPLRRFSCPEVHQRFATMVKELSGAIPITVGPLIAGRSIDSDLRMESVNPSHPSMVIGQVLCAGVQHVEPAISAAQAALENWTQMQVRQRSELILKAAGWLRQHRDRAAALEILEAGKPWDQADADVAEAIDHMTYYAHQAVRLLESKNLDVPGEENIYEYRPRGVAAIIAPWNFPLAIPAGMATAALVAGNTIIIKPAPQTPATAQLLLHALEQAGVPSGVVNFLPGGDDVGKALVTSPGINLIAFTGSESVGRQIYSAASTVAPGQRQLKHVIAEMGGKNAIIVDSDADLDQAVAAITCSAFGYAGQKCSACSRVIVVGDAYEELLEDLIDATASLNIGPAEDPSTFIGPVISAEARDRIRRAVEAGAAEARLIFHGRLPEAMDGYFVEPAIFTDVPLNSSLALEEIFGPVLAVFRVDSFEQAVALANDTRFGLTGGVLSRNPHHIQFARRRLQVGNLYINRRITGAAVGRQPFGGMKMSGTGSRAGGPDYLLEFVQGRTITENTVRRGFVPPE